MNLTRILAGKLLFVLVLLGLPSCTLPTSESANANNQQTATNEPVSQKTAAENQACTLVEDGFGSQGQVNVRAEEVVTGLEVPWGIAFLPNQDMLVTERAGRVRLVRNGKLIQKPVATINVTDRGEGGLLGIATHPNFTAKVVYWALRLIQTLLQTDFSMCTILLIEMGRRSIASNDGDYLRMDLAPRQIG